MHKWYKKNTEKEGLNLSLLAWNNNQGLPQVFDASDKWNALRADRIGDEFGVQYIIKTSGNEYQRIAEIAATGSTLIVPLNFPMAMDVEDPNDARFVSTGRHETLGTGTNQRRGTGKSQDTFLPYHCRPSLPYSIHVKPPQSH